MNSPGDQLPLRDIHLPEPVSWWPPAPGWWLLLILLVGAVLLVRWWLKRQPALKPHKLALQELRAIESAYAEHGDPQRLIQALSILLRRTVISCLPRQQAASLTGHAWLDQLNRLVDEPLFDDSLGRQLLEAPYSNKPDVDADALVLCDLMDHLQHLIYVISP